MHDAQLSARVRIRHADDVIEYRGMKRLIELAASLMIECPGHECATAAKAREHDPDFHPDRQLGEALDPESADGHIHDATAEPAFALSPQLDSQKHRLPVT
jgi:hypothetical protein